MAKASPFIASANSGEFSPRMDARVDFDKYLTAISRGLNLTCLPQGGLTTRPGTRFVEQVDGISALVPFSPVSDRSYMLRFSEEALSIYRNQAPLEAPTAGGSITNGGFDANIGSWTDLSIGSGTIAWASSGAMRLTGGGTGQAWGEQSVVVTTNVTQVFRFQLLGNYGSSATVQVGTASGDSDLFKASGMGMGWHTVGVLSDISPVYFQVINENLDDIYLDNVEMLSNQPIVVFTPYNDIEFRDIRTAQSADVLYCFHDLVPIHKVERHGDASWSVVQAFIQDGPWLGINPETDLAATNLLKNPRFDNGLTDWDRDGNATGYVAYQDGVVLLSAWDTDAGNSAAIAQTVATPAPNTVHVLHYQVWGGGDVHLGISVVNNSSSEILSRNDGAGWYSVEFTPTAATFYIHWNVDNDTPLQSGITAAFCYCQTARLLEPSDVDGDITVTAHGFGPFDADDIGRLIRFEYPGAEPGWGIITDFTDSQSVDVRVYRTLVRDARMETWRLGAWSETTGFPHVGVFYQQRLMTARTSAQPQSLWGSQTADFENFRPDSWVEGAAALEDDDGLNFTIAADRVTPIMWMAGSRRLVVGTGSGQWLIVSSSNKAAITPSDFSADPQTSIPALDIAPVQIDNVVLFAQKAKRTIFDLGYASDADSFRAADVTILADHITRGNIAQIVYQGEPFSNVWVRLESGTLACLTYKRGQNVVGWTPVEIAGTDASVESIAVIPGDNADDGQVFTSINRDEVWMLVSRTVNNTTVYYVEVMEGYFDGPNRAVYLDKEEWRDAMREAQVEVFYVDSGLTYDGVFVDAVSGLDHLEGETVAIVADGASREPQVVAGGSVPLLPIGGSFVHVGLPYQWVYRSLKLPYGSPTGQGVGQAKTISGLVIVLRDSGALQYAIDMTGEGESEATLEFFDVPIRRPDDDMGVAVPLFSGEIEHNPGGGYASDPRVVMRGLSDGLPFTLLGIVPKVAESEL
jgi:hypothetical protein